MSSIFFLLLIGLVVSQQPCQNGQCSPGSFCCGGLCLPIPDPSKAVGPCIAQYPQFPDIVCPPGACCYDDQCYNAISLLGKK